jgi:CelD/BcsL family acetyltransferase involved in cellulose biosynthesis
VDPRSAAAPQVVSQILRDTRSFAQLAREWDELLDASSQQCYFMRWRWNFLWWTHLAPRQASLRIVVCRDVNGVLVGLSPLYLLQRKAFNLIPIRELVFLGTGVGLKTSEHLNIAVRRGYEDVATRSMAAELNRCCDWDRLSCSRVPEDSTVMRLFFAAIANTAKLRSFETAPFIDTSTGWAGYKSSLGRSMRRNVEYYARRLFKRYECQFQRVASNEELLTALEALVTLHIDQWRSRGEVGSLSNPLFQRFFRDAARNSFTESRLRVWTLRINGRIEAALLGFLDGGVLHYFQTGHNPAFAKDDLGTVLVSLCVRDCCDDPDIRAFDFMGGGADYKQMWARQARTTVLGEVTRNTVRARTLALQDRLVGAAASFYRAIMPMSVRAMRRDWLKARNLREQTRRIAQSVTGALAAVTTLSHHTGDPATAVADLVLPILIGLMLR